MRATLTGTNGSVAGDAEAYGGPQDGEDPGQRYQQEAVILNPAGRSLVVGKDEICADGNDQDKIVGLDYEDLRHKAVEAAEALLRRVADISPSEVHGRRR